MFIDTRTELYALIDDLTKEFQPASDAKKIQSGKPTRLQAPGKSAAELIIWVVLLYQSRYGQIKAFDVIHVRLHLLS